jgi:hypothetical protein
LPDIHISGGESELLGFLQILRSSRDAYNYAMDENSQNMKRVSKIEMRKIRMKNHRNKFTYGDVKDSQLSLERSEHMPL